MTHGMRAIDAIIPSWPDVPWADSYRNSKADVYRFFQAATLLVSVALSHTLAL